MVNNSILDAEYSVVGSLLIDGERLADEVLSRVGAEDFSHPTARKVIKAVEALHNDGKPLDFVTIGNALGNIDSATHEFLRECMELTPTTVNAVSYCEIVRKAALRERLAEALDKAQNDTALGEDCIGIVTRLTAEIEDLEARDASSGLTSGGELMEAYVQEQTEAIQHPGANAVETHYRALDDALGLGLQRGGLYIIAARPGMGKTTFALNVADQMALAGKNILFVSLEMTMRQVMNKRISRASGIDYTRLQSGKVNPNELGAISEAARRLTECGFALNTNYNLTTADVFGLVRRAGEIDAVFIDYFGLITPTESSGSRYEDYTAISRQLKQLALRADIPVIALAQLNREAPKRGEKKPQLSDLRDTGALEQDADGVIFLHRDDYYDTADITTAKEVETVEVILAKNRHGRTGKIKMTWLGNQSRIIEQTSRTDEPGGGFKELTGADASCPWD